MLLGGCGMMEYETGFGLIEFEAVSKCEPVPGLICESNTFLTFAILI